MSKKRRGRLFRMILALALGGNLVLLADALTTGRIVPGARAQATSPESEEPVVWEQEGGGRLETVYRELIASLRSEQDELTRRAGVLEERERQAQVLLVEAERAWTELEAARAADEEKNEGEGFQLLLRAYENMEPENAARALENLYEKDSRAVTDTLLGMGPRKSGAILDALASTRPDLAASISFEIIRRGDPPEPAGLAAPAARAPGGEEADEEG